MKSHDEIDKILVKQCVPDVPHGTPCDDKIKINSAGTASFYGSRPGQIIVDDVFPMEPIEEEHDLT